MNGPNDDLPEIPETESRVPGTPGVLDEDIDESYSPPERPLAMNRFGTTAFEYATGESLSRRMAEEEPEVWEADEAAATEAGADGLAGDDEIDPRGGRATGRLTWAGNDADDAPDTWAHDTRTGGDDASSEEAAMHVIEDE